MAVDATISPCYPNRYLGAAYFAEQSHCNAVVNIRVYLRRPEMQRVPLKLPRWIRRSALAGSFVFLLSSPSLAASTVAADMPQPSDFMMSSSTWTLVSAPVGMELLAPTSSDFVDFDYFVYAESNIPLIIVDGTQGVGVQAAVVPLPAAAWLFAGALGALGLYGARHRRHR